jgi:hypothetical protein
MQLFCYTRYQAAYIARVAAIPNYKRVNTTALCFSGLARYYVCIVPLQVRNIIILSTEGT